VDERLRLNQFLGEQEIINNHHEKQALAQQMATVLERRKTEADADADDLSIMAWLALHLNQEAQALEYVKVGLQKDPENYHCFAQRKYRKEKTLGCLLFVVVQT
jgi:hypothetical protein